ncbi:hypothetical protein ACH5RR_026429 [Cinchona calisaya]|uniref:Uncharacterized protein n=1 Tax=Cinchona calisaya TaxID=153742 RepID=A0ABD2Z5R1_9GENT
MANSKAVLFVTLFSLILVHEIVQESVNIDAVSLLGIKCALVHAIRVARDAIVFRQAPLQTHNPWHAPILSSLSSSYRGQKLQDLERVMNGRPWVLDNQLMVLERWKENLEQDKKAFSESLMWIQLWNLLMH